MLELQTHDDDEDGLMSDSFRLCVLCLCESITPKTPTSHSKRFHQTRTALSDVAMSAALVTAVPLIGNNEGERRRRYTFERLREKERSARRKRKETDDLVRITVLFS